MENSSQGGNTSLLQDLLNQVPSGMFGGKDQAGKADELQANATAAQMQNTHISPRQPEAWTRQLQEVRTLEGIFLQILAETWAFRPRLESKHRSFAQTPFRSHFSWFTKCLKLHHVNSNFYRFKSRFTLLSNGTMK